MKCETYALAYRRPRMAASRRLFQDFHRPVLAVLSLSSHGEARMSNLDSVPPRANDSFQVVRCVRLQNYGGKLSLRSSAVKRGSVRIDANSGSILILARPPSSWRYARSSHSKALSFSPRHA